MTSTTLSDQTAMRKEAEMALGVDESVIRVEWVCANLQITF